MATGDIPPACADVATGSFPALSVSVCPSEPFPKGNRMTDQDTRVVETVAVRRDGSVAIVELDRPEALNAVNGQMLRELQRVLSDLTRDNSVRSLVLASSGDAFCSGADVKDPYFEDPDPRVQSERVALGYSVVRLLREVPFPTVCAVNGVCVAIGLSLAGLCDVRIASSDARFVLGFARVGIFPDMGGSILLPKLVGQAKALELVVLDEPIDAARAESVGLVSEVVAPERLRARALEVARRLTRRSGAATRLTRQVLHDVAAMPFADAVEAEAAAVARHVRTHDLREGISAVREGRHPHFSDR